MSNEIVVQGQSNAVMAFHEKESMAEAVAKSGMFGLKDKSQALVLMALCESEGLHPMRACAEYNIINGRPSLKADAILARFQRSGGTVCWNETTDEKCEGTFSHPQGGKITVEWTLERAQAIGLGGKDNWRNYPRQMLRARVVSEAIRAILPGICTGIYTPEEVMDFDAPKETPVHSTKSKPVDLTKRKADCVKAIFDLGVEVPEEAIENANSEDELYQIFEKAKQSNDMDDMMGTAS